MNRLRPPAAMVFALLILGACAGSGKPGSPAGPSAGADPATANPTAGNETPGSALILSRLYFGTASPQGPVSPADFETFLDTCVTSRFPAGLTRYAADGQWRGSDGKLVKEKSVVVEIIRPDDAGSAKRIGEIIERYKSRFAQEAVLLVEEKPSIRF